MRSTAIRHTLDAASALLVLTGCLAAHADWVTLTNHIRTIPHETLFFADSGLTAGTTYYYTVRAENAAGAGAYTPPVSAMTGSTASEPFTAYNDLAWMSKQTASNITAYTAHDPAAGRIGAGLLTDYASGRTVMAKLDVQGLHLFGAAGVHPKSGTDAHAVFTDASHRRIVDCDGNYWYGTNDRVLHLTGLDPVLRYEIVLYCDRNKRAYVGGDSRYHSSTLFGAVSFVNASTPGTVISTNQQAGDTTCYNAGYNNELGYVTRFRDIDPGPDGAFGLRVSRNSSQDEYTYANAVMLKAMTRILAPTGVRIRRVP
ncbi:MAG: fibronectin type III domain-containing protein [Kiritimatiellae bacterium]|nr:fibronectin type III domain-containing protein [Kiritimatiellia bacterium]